MSGASSNPPGPVNHVFVDYENVHEIDLTLIGSKTVTFTLLVGPARKTLDVALVEKLFQQAASVQLVRLTSAGRNALDFTLVYYVGRAVAADPTGSFHIMSKDKGYDPLIRHLQGKHIHVLRHEDFTALAFLVSTKPQTPSASVAAPKAKPEPKPKTRPPSGADEQETRVLAYLRKLAAKRPRRKDRLVSSVVTHLGHKITEAEALRIVEDLGQAGHLFIDDKSTVTYHLDSK
jgi:hypothetical protein